MEGVNSFVKFFNLGYAETSAIELRDTEGTPIFCNWFRLSLNNTIANKAKVLVLPTGVYSANINPLIASGVAVAQGASGIGGFMAQGGEGTSVEHTFLTSTSSVNVRQMGASTAPAEIALTYGVKGVLPPLKGVIRSTGS